MSARNVRKSKHCPCLQNIPRTGTRINCLVYGSCSRNTSRSMATSSSFWADSRLCRNYSPWDGRLGRIRSKRVFRDGLKIWYSPIIKSPVLLGTILLVDARWREDLRTMTISTNPQSSISNEVTLNAFSVMMSVASLLRRKLTAW